MESNVPNPGSTISHETCFNSRRCRHYFKWQATTRLQHQLHNKLPLKSEWLPTKSVTSLQRDHHATQRSRTRHRLHTNSQLAYTEPLSIRCIREPFIKTNLCKARRQSDISLSNGRRRIRAQPSISILSLLVSYLILLLLPLPLTTSIKMVQASERMVRLCIASVDPVKLSSQCVMCKRAEFPLMVLDCTYRTKVNELISNPLTVQEAKCLIYNCRRQVPLIKPEPYHGSVNNAANYRGVGGASAALGSNYHQQRMPGSVAAGGLVPQAPLGMMMEPPAGVAEPPSFNSAASSSSLYEMMTPSGLYGQNHYTNNNYAQQQHSSMSNQAMFQAPFMSRYGYPASSMLASSGGASPGYSAAASGSQFSMRGPRGLIGGPNLMSAAGQQALPYALVPAPPSGLLPFGLRKYRAALVPLF